VWGLPQTWSSSCQILFVGAGGCPRRKEAAIAPGAQSGRPDDVRPLRT
jgi:hypothetical protein